MQPHIVYGAGHRHSIAGTGFLLKRIAGYLATQRVTQRHRRSSAPVTCLTPALQFTTKAFSCIPRSLRTSCSLWPQGTAATLFQALLQRLVVSKSSAAIGPYPRLSSLGNTTTSAFARTFSDCQLLLISGYCDYCYCYCYCQKLNLSQHSFTCDRRPSYHVLSWIAALAIAGQALELLAHVETLLPAPPG